MNKKKIAILVPCKSNAGCLEDTEIYRTLLPSFIKTKSPEFSYTFYIGTDANDELFDNIDSVIGQLDAESISAIHIKFPSSIAPGHLTKMWNCLFEQAYNHDCDYFYQCGDDVKLLHSGWIDQSIASLEAIHDYGVTGPSNPHNSGHILTQTFVSRRHMEVFGYFFPEEIKNYYCDDWINTVYQSCSMRFMLNNYHLENTLFAGRYEPESSKAIYLSEIDRGITHLSKHIATNRIPFSNTKIVKIKARSILRILKRTLFDR